MSRDLKRIVFGMSGGAHDKLTAEYVFCLASRAEAEVECHVIRPIADDPQLLMMSGFIGNAFKALVESAELTLSEFDVAARQAVENAAERYPNVKYTYADPQIDRDVEFATFSWGADLLVLAHPALVNVQYYRNQVWDAINDSGRPVLLLPEQLPSEIFGEARFGWRDDPHCAMVSAMALPLLRIMSSVRFFTIAEEDISAEKRPAVLRFYEAHGVSAHYQYVHQESRRLERAIEHYCNDSDAALIILGRGMQSEVAQSFVDVSPRHVRHRITKPLLVMG